MAGIVKTKEAEQFIELFRTDAADKRKYKKLSNIGDETREKNGSDFLTDPDEARKLLRKKKSVKAKTKRTKGCGCK